MDFLLKHFYGVFELPLPRNAQKRTKKKVKGEKKSDGGWVWDLVNGRGGPSIFFCRPLGFGRASAHILYARWRAGHRRAIFEILTL